MKRCKLKRALPHAQRTRREDGQERLLFEKLQYLGAPRGPKFPAVYLGFMGLTFFCNSLRGLCGLKAGAPAPAAFDYLTAWALREAPDAGCG